MNTWRRVAGLFHEHRGAVATSLGLVLVSVGLTSVPPLLLRPVIDDALPRHDVTGLAELCAAMLVAGLLAAGVSVLHMSVTNRTGQRVLHRLRADVYDRVARMPLDFFARHPNSEVQSRLVSDIDGINDVLTFTAQGTLAGLVNLAVCVVVMVFLSWPLAILSILLALLLNLGNNVFARRRAAIARSRQEQVSELLRVVGEDLAWSGVALGRTLNRRGAQRERFVAVSRRIAELAERQRVTSGKAYAMVSVVFSALPPLIYWASGTVLSGVTIGTVVVVATLQARLSAPLQTLLSLSGTVQSSRAMFERVFEYVDLPAPREPVVVRRPGSHVRLHGISHTYGNRTAVAAVWLDIPPGTTTLIVGQTGSGKSTLSLILAGLLAPTAGHIEADRADLRRVVTLAPQEAVLFNTTLRENLMFADPAATPWQVRDAISAACLDDLLARLPDGLDTEVGERGYQLSGGERQRVALARALLAPGDVLVLDEATSALDAETAERVNAALLHRRSPSSLVIIAHRIPRLRPYDRVVVMDRGYMVQYGTHADLAYCDGPYRYLLALSRSAEVAPSR